VDGYRRDIATFGLPRSLLAARRDFQVPHFIRAHYGIPLPPRQYFRPGVPYKHSVRGKRF
jgi:hypothetical protein